MTLQTEQRWSLLLLAAIAIQLLFLVFAIAGAPAPQVNMEEDGAEVAIAADRAWLLLPGQCARVAWAASQSLSISILGQARDNINEMTYCPGLRSDNLMITIGTANGAQESLRLNLRYLPSDIIKCLVLLVLASLLALAFYFLRTNRLSDPLPIGKFHLLCLLAIFCFCLLCQCASAFRIELLLDGTSRLFSSPAWQALGLLLTALVFVPLVWQLLRESQISSARNDIVAIAAFFIFLLMLYLPFGFDSVGHWEEWLVIDHLENGYPGLISEMHTRFWILVPNVFASLISPQSFMGYHLVNFLMFWGSLAFFYGILRKIKLDPLYAFLATLLFMVYPVNIGLMSVRHFLMNARVLSLIAAVFCFLQYMERSSRLRLAGTWLALLLHVGSYEAGYVIIAVLPIWWWRQKPRGTWRHINLSIIWYLFPILKLVFLLLLFLEKQPFYGSSWITDTPDANQLGFHSIAFYVGIIERVYLQTFWYGWREALSVFSQSAWIPPVLGAVTFSGLIAAYLGRDVTGATFPSRRRLSAGLLSSALFILPTIGVLMWLDRYNTDLRRMYIFVPMGAAIAAICLILLAASFIKRRHIHTAFVIGICLAAMMPALARLYVQKAQFLASANNKAWILLQTVEQAPAINEGANIIILTEMLGVELRAKGISELRTNMLNSAMNVLYEQRGPDLAFLCIMEKRCFKDELDLPPFHLSKDANYSDFLIFMLHDDLSVELLRELPPELGGASNATYNPARLIDTSAPLPPRAITMLSSAEYTAMNP